MKDKDWFRKLFVLLSHPSLFKNNKEYIFVLGHMRSRSSVLSHVLGSHDDIMGYTELHRSYRQPSSLLKMRVDLFEEFGKEYTGRYLLDKVLHNNLDPTLQVVELANPKLIFMLREPKGYTTSLIRLGCRLKNANYASPEFTVKHYIERIELLESLPALYGRPYFFINSDNLVKNTQPILSELSEFLQLDKPLSAEYKKFEKTGKKKFGDSSENINSGVITDTTGKIDTPSEDYGISEALLAPAYAAHQRCKKLLISGAVNADSLLTSGEIN